MSENSRTHKKIVQEYFSNKTKYWSVLYNEQHDQDSFMNYIMRRRKFYVLKTIDDEFESPDQLNVLDVGCGTGVYAGELLNRKFNVFGVDLSKEMVRKARLSVADNSKGNLKLSTGDAEILPFKNSSFDLIIAVGLLEYLPSEKNALKEFNRLLKPGGILIFTLPNIYKLQHFLDPFYILMWSLRLLKRLVKSGNRKVEPRDFDYNENMIIKRYKKKQIHSFLKLSSLCEKKVTAVGFGAFTIFNKKIFSLNASIKISDYLEKLSAFGYLSLLISFSTRWVICAQKQKD